MQSQAKWSIPPYTKSQVDSSTKFFLETVANQDHHVQKFRAQEIQSTAENPYVRKENNLNILSEKLVAQKREDILKQKRCQQLRDNSTVLQELTRKINIAKAILAQQEQREYIEREKNSQHIAKKQRILINRKYQAEMKEFEAAEQARIQQQKQELRECLLHQIAEKKNLKHVQFQQKMLEREHMRDVMRRLNEDTNKRISAQKLNKRVICAEMLDHIRADKECLKRKRLQSLNEGTHVQNLDRQREENRQKMLKVKRAERAHKEELSHRIGESLRQAYIEKENHEILLQDLLVEERKANEDQRYKEALAQKMEIRRQLNLELQRYEKIAKEAIRRTEKEHAKREMSTQIHMMSLMLQHEKEKEELCKEMDSEYHVTIRDQIIENAHHREGEVLLEKALEKKCEQETLDFDKEVEMERRYLLSQQPEEILKLLPKIGTQ